MRHKGNLERYIRDIYKKGSKQGREKAEEARQIASIDAAAAAAMGISPEQASTSGSAARFRRKGASSSSSAPSYTTATDLGFTDPEAERIQREKEEREKAGVAGDWTFVAPVPGSSRERATSAIQEDEASNASNEPARAEREEPDNRKVSHAYLKEKSLPVLDDEDYDKIQIKVRTPKQSTATKDALAKAREQARTQAPPSDELRKQKAIDGKAKFKVVDLQEYEETPEEQDERYKAALELIDPKHEAEDNNSVPPATTSSKGAPMFKKRKAKSGDDNGGAKRRG